jgi:hypothetical protein
VAVQDRGQLFFPDFTDPNAAVSLEIVEFDEETSVARPFKVLNRDGRWTIPSHASYPSDASNRLSLIAASIITLKKDDVAGDNPRDEERCGVLDPLDETLPTTKGRGTRITVKGRNEKVLADIIIGKAVDGRPNLHYVRLPGGKRTYISRAENLNISTRFADWIERNLLQVDRDDIDQIIIRNYSAEAQTGKVDLREMLVLAKKGRDLWAAADMSGTETIDTFKMNLLITKLVDLAIVDVRPKPASVVASLTEPSGKTKVLQSDVADLATKGFYFTPDGQMLSGQGEVVVHTSTGIFYILRFGGVAYGTGDNVYLFISAAFDPNATTGTLPGAETKRLEVLRARFAPWYYVVSNDNFRKIRLERKDLVKARTARPTK